MKSKLERTLIEMKHRISLELAEGHSNDFRVEPRYRVKSREHRREKRQQKHIVPRLQHVF